MRIGILGTGDVGQALGKAFVALGHDVMMGGREAKNAKAEAWACEAGELASVGTFRDAASFGEVVVLATLGTANASAIEAAGPAAFSGKVVIDATNPLDFTAGMPPRLATGPADSGGEEVQRLLLDAKVVKAFNTVGNAHMFRPDFPGGPPDMFIAGNDAEAKRSVTRILDDFGWNVIDAGSIEASRYLEGLCILWVAYGVHTGGWNHAFKLLHK
jgi:predicted dinucleotide-binding enzyme